MHVFSSYGYGDAVPKKLNTLIRYELLQSGSLFEIQYTNPNKKISAINKMLFNVICLIFKSYTKYRKKHYLKLH